MFIAFLKRLIREEIAADRKEQAARQEYELDRAIFTLNEQGYCPRHLIHVGTTGKVIRSKRMFRYELNPCPQCEPDRQREAEERARGVQEQVSEAIRRLRDGQ
jgi:hypothetical protein